MTQHAQQQPGAIGVDIGGVLTQHTTREDDTSFWGDRYLESPEVPGAFDGLASLVAAGWAVSLVSKCGRRTERKTREWLRHHDLEKHTGVSPWSIWFCEQRADKAEIATVLRLDAFVDDRRDVLDALPKRVRTRLWFEADWSSPKPETPPLVDPVPTADWSAVLRLLGV